MSDTAPERLDAQQLAALFAASPYISGLHLEVQAIDYPTSTLTLRMPLHAALIDVTGDFAIGMMVGGGVPTVNLRIDYLKPAVGDASPRRRACGARAGPSR